MIDKTNQLSIRYAENDTIILWAGTYLSNILSRIPGVRRVETEFPGDYKYKITMDVRYSFAEVKANIEERLRRK